MTFNFGLILATRAEDGRRLFFDKFTVCSAAIINVYDFIDDFISFWFESLYE